MRNNFSKYINDKLKELKWLDKDLVEKSKISKGQISKLKKGEIEKITADTYYKIYTAFADSCEKVTKQVFGHIELNIYKSKPRTRLGNLLFQLEENKNSMEEISKKTGITETRLKALYFNNGSPDAYELLLIEKAVGKEPGELFEMYFG